MPPDEYELHSRTRPPPPPPPPPPDAFDFSDDDEHYDDDDDDDDDDGDDDHGDDRDGDIGGDSAKYGDDDDDDGGGEPSSSARLLAPRARTRRKRRQHPAYPVSAPWWGRWLSAGGGGRRRRRHQPAKPQTGQPRRGWARRCSRRCCQLLGLMAAAASTWLVLTGIFRPSYTAAQQPAAWHALDAHIRAGGGANPANWWSQPPPGADAGGGRRRRKTTTAGRGNPAGERVFIAANIVDGPLIASEWGARVLELVDLLGPANVFLSVFENDAGADTRRALQQLALRLGQHMPGANHSIVSTTMPLARLPRVRTPGANASYVKRIAYLAELRNRALLPLVGDIPSLARWGQAPRPTGEKRKVDKQTTAEDDAVPAMPTSWVPHPESVARVLFLNDVVFSPHEMAHLLFSTNAGDYAAACALDFIGPLKFYDTFATRDADGYPIGLPFFPFFARGAARAQLLATAPAVPVRACWGGAVAFNASVFTRARAPVRFRAEPEPFWDASECCLVHADIAEPARTFVNPFVRVAYGRATFDWLPFARRFERAFAPVHGLLSWALGMPWGGPRRAESPGQPVHDLAWDGHGWIPRQRVATRGGWCGAHKLLVMVEGAADGHQRRWRSLPVPVPPARD